MTKIPDIPVLEETLRRIQESLDAIPQYGQASVYGLFEAGAPSVLHYIGYTNQVPPQKRLRKHFFELRKGRQNRVYCWIREVMQRGGSIEMQILATGLSIESALVLEDDLIFAFMQMFPLKNDFIIPTSCVWAY